MLRRILPLSVFARYERWWERRHGLIHYAPGSLLRLEIRTHRGRPVVVGDGTVVRPGDPIGEIHIDNMVVADYHRQTSDPRRLGLLFGRGMAEALRLLASYLKANPDRRIVAVHAVSLYWEGSERLGFEIRPIRSWWARWAANAWLKFLLWYYHPEGVRRSRGRERLREPREAWMSFQRLMERHGSDGAQ
ncbi:MAG: hypothetical protein QN163_05545 [Armatimonadota bacterium]|nr:hypothetical protein [Armatimonadota bacterium]MDR5696204.1 hypothetical protein [Armatimonadota bacterium]